MINFGVMTHEFSFKCSNQKFTFRDNQILIFNSIQIYQQTNQPTNIWINNNPILIDKRERISVFCTTLFSLVAFWISFLFFWQPINANTVTRLGYFCKIFATIFLAKEAQIDIDFLG